MPRLIALGTGFLKLPIATPEPITWSDAVFTATSAVTVTGLVVIDTGSQLTLFGQAVIIVLIQLGGLGLMTFAVLVLSMLGLPVGMSHRIFLREDLNQTSISDLLVLVRDILKVVLACEIVGLVLLSFVFVPEFGWAEGLWQALVPHRLGLQQRGLRALPRQPVAWVGNPLVNLVVPALFIFGGLGFVVVTELFTEADLAELLAAHQAHDRRHAGADRLVGPDLRGCWNGRTRARSVGSTASRDRLWASWFQGVTTRTAGFNTVDIGAIHDSTAMMFMSLMVIGGGSTSTAGGIKVTTFIVLLLATLAFFKRRTQLHVFGRSLGSDEVMKVLALTMVSMLTVFSAIFLITISHDGDFLDLAFEVTSAFGTVGLSRGATGELDALGRAVIIAVMFIGRVGPLTLGFFLATHAQAAGRATRRARYIWADRRAGGTDILGWSSIAATIRRRR